LLISRLEQAKIPTIRTESKERTMAKLAPNEKSTNTAVPKPKREVITQDCNSPDGKT